MEPKLLFLPVSKNYINLNLVACLSIDPLGTKPDEVGVTYIGNSTGCFDCRYDGQDGQAIKQYAHAHAVNVPNQF